jgi:hypothetical protein
MIEPPLSARIGRFAPLRADDRDDHVAVGNLRAETPDDIVARCDRLGVGEELVRLGRLLQHGQQAPVSRRSSVRR